MKGNEANKKGNKKRLLIELLISLLFLAGCVVFIYTSHAKAELRIIMKVRVDLEKEDTFQLFVENKRFPEEARIRPTIRIQTIRFNLPGEKLRNLRIVLGEVPGHTVIRSLSVRGWFKSYTFRGNRLKKLFPARDTTARHMVRKRRFIIEASRPRYELVPGDAFYSVLDRMQTGRALFYIPALVLSLLFFYLLHSLDFRFKTLRMFFNRKLVSGGVSVVFLILFAPLLSGLFTGNGKTELAEKKSMGRGPGFRFDAVFSYLEEYGSHYDRHFPHRGQLIYLNNLLTVKMFGVSPTDRLLVGKEGWLFLDQQPNRPGTVNYYRSLTLFSREELEAWKTLLEERKEWLARRGIHYLFLIVPNKNTIYPEYMPDHIRKVNTMSRMDQLLDYLKRHSSVTTVDVRPALLEARQRRPVFHATDSHWNDYGAFVVAGEVMKTISVFPGYGDAKPLPLERFKLETVNHSGGDLAAMLSLHQEVMRENMIDLTPVPDWQFTGGGLKRISLFIKQGYTRNPNAVLPNVVMVHDSFYKKIKPFLSEQFTRIRYIWDWDMGFYPGIIEQEKPKLVIDEMAERFLLDNIPVNPKKIKEF